MPDYESRPATLDETIQDYFEFLLCTLQATSICPIT